MKKVLLISFVILSVTAQMTHAQKQAVIKLTEKTLMHEMRATPYPLDKAVVNDPCGFFSMAAPFGLKLAGQSVGWIRTQM